MKKLAMVVWGIALLLGVAIVLQSCGNNKIILSVSDLKQRASVLNGKFVTVQGVLNGTTVIPTLGSGALLTDPQTGDYTVLIGKQETLPQGGTDVIVAGKVNSVCLLDICETVLQSFTVVSTPVF